MDIMKVAAANHLKVLKRRYNAWCNWQAKWEVYWAAYMASRVRNEAGEIEWDVPAPCPVPYPKGRPSKNSKYSAYEACHFFRTHHGVTMATEDYGTVREWRNTLLALGVKNVKPLPKCNQK